MNASQLRVILNGVSPEAEVVFEVQDGNGDMTEELTVTSVAVVTADGGLRGELIREVRLS